jgi:putative membrane protein insertion efficiency factor
LSQALRRIGIAVLTVPIHVYRRLLSPFLPPACRFTPTCSAYAIEAIETHGPLKGFILAAKRILRCHPIHWLGGSEGFDPVPPRPSRSK